MSARRIVVLNGPGFADQEDLTLVLESRGDHVERVSICSPELRTRLATADVILLRAPWTASPEERLLSRQVAMRLEESFEDFEIRFKKAATANQPTPKIIGVGRGALVLLASRNFGLCDFDTLEWRPALEQEGPWIEIKTVGGALVLTSLVQGRALPHFQGGKFHKEVVPWLTMRGPSAAQMDPVGLKQGTKIFLSFTDILALGDRMQLLDFGYREYPTTLPLRGQVLASLVDGVL